MIRVALVSLAFLAVTLTLILLHPTSRPYDLRGTHNVDALDSSNTVSRAQMELDQVANPALHASGEQQLNSTMSATPQAAKTEIETLIVAALRQGQSSDYIDALVNHAAKRGEVDVPQALITSDGRVDTASLVSALSPSSDASNDKPKLYTVQPGDSLASIAFRFYGSTTHAPDLFKANIETMGAPSNIAVGQRLVLPDI